MVYVNSAFVISALKDVAEKAFQDGTITEKPPFSISRLFGWFWGILNFFYMFAYTLFNPGRPSNGSRYSVDYRPPGSSGRSRPDNFRGFGPANRGPDAPPCSGCGCG